jgi:Tol biopolymer transport system component
MPIANGTRLGPYEIVSELGAGGMGEVYAARDTRLDRTVAIKVLPASFANDADRLRRFEQEARATSALNHPNILTVYDIGSHEGSPYIVAELLEGEELRAHLPPQSEAGALPVRKAMDYAQQIAAGLAAAHEKGIVHRDLKPENLFVTKDGRVKILDFGLAKLKPPQVESVDSQAPTQKRITDPGVVMGTVGYMSPEQVRGQEADHRADIFAFGVILYEMLSGRRTFTGDSAADVMSAILKEEPPDLGETNAKISPALDKIVRRCLEKKPEHRFHSAHDLGFALEALTTPSSSGANRMEAALALDTSATTKGGRRRERIAWIVAGMTTLALLALGVAYFRRPAPEAETVRLAVTPPEKATRFDWPTISPDGRTLAFIAAIGGKTQLWVRPLNSTTAKPLAEANSTNWLFWSPDSRFIAFFHDGKLKKITPNGGTAETICNATVMGGAWNQEGVILFATGTTSGIKRISANGGAGAQVTTIDAARGEITHQFPVFLPDGQHFLFFARNTDPAKSCVYVASLEGGVPRQLLLADSRTVAVAVNPAVKDEGWLLFTQQGALLAQPFDFRRKELVGERVQLAAQVVVDGFGAARFSVAANGTLALLEGSAERQLTWLDRAGKRIATVGQPGLWGSTRLSPDEQRLAVVRRESQALTVDLYLWDLARRTETRFTFDPGNDGAPIWSPDGSRIVWFSDREGEQNLYVKAASGAGQDELLWRSAYAKTPLSWSADGRFLLFREQNPQTRGDLWVLPMEGGRQPWPWLNTPAIEGTAAFSPDGKWIVYASDESGRYEIYAQAFAPSTPASGGKVPLSTNGGVTPQWRRDGRELYYRSPDNKLIAVDVTLGAQVKAGTPRELFSLVSNFEAAHDGQRFLVAASAVDTSVPPFTVVLNWMAEVKK